MTRIIAEVQSAFDINAWFDTSVPTPTRKKEPEKTPEPPASPTAPAEGKDQTGTGTQAEPTKKKLERKDMREYEGNAPKADSSPIEADGTISVTKKLSDPNHPAIDVGQANGQKVRSMYDGKITFAAKADSDQADGKDIGGWITVESYRKDGTTFAARYLHNGPLLEAGTYVTAGTAIGETRQPGSPSYGGNHIHIEIHTSDAGLSSKGATVDPSTVLKAWLP